MMVGWKTGYTNVAKVAFEIVDRSAFPNFSILWLELLLSWLQVRMRIKPRENRV